ncbi:hypothetical protein FHR92_001945 [Fontibacillus solani]|uniref:Uncharacterized protein n=1 Tax=Fontibacillus solani TaxID=1572857 RepID=A0A7W3SSV8_9BACL|nr:hypothetical protein [Fontibacillus solani]MBA9085479.1 hypothetical protein [Fontibacillus solani]
MNEALAGVKTGVLARELLRLQEIEEKYNKAKTLLGEKEIEIEILREL